MDAESENLVPEIADSLICGYVVFVHRDSGKMLRMIDAMDLNGYAEDDSAEDRDRIADTIDSWIAVSEPGSSESLGIMEDFAGSRPPGSGKNRSVERAWPKQALPQFNRLIHNAVFRKTGFASADKPIGRT